MTKIEFEHKIKEIFKQNLENIEIKYILFYNEENLISIDYDPKKIIVNFNLLNEISKLTGSNNIEILSGNYLFGGRYLLLVINDFCLEE